MVDWTHLFRFQMHHHRAIALYCWYLWCHAAFAYGHSFDCVVWNVNCTRDMDTLALAHIPADSVVAYFYVANNLCHIGDIWSEVIRHAVVLASCATVAFSLNSSISAVQHSILSIQRPYHFRLIPFVIAFRHRCTDWWYWVELLTIDNWFGLFIENENCAPNRERAFFVYRECSRWVIEFRAPQYVAVM